jgi:hypothetical protein
MGGMLLPLLAGICLGWIFLPHSQFFVAQVLFTGIALAITAPSRRRFFPPDSHTFHLWDGKSAGRI